MTAKEEAQEELDNAAETAAAGVNVVALTSERLEQMVRRGRHKDLGISAAALRELLQGKVEAAAGARMPAITKAAGRVEKNRELVADGLSTREAAAVTGVSSETVRRDTATNVAPEQRQAVVEEPPAATNVAPDPAIKAASDAIESHPDIRAANLRRGFTKWTADIHRVHLFDPQEIADLDPELGDGIGFSVKRLNEWWAEYQAARRQGLHVISGGKG